MVLLPWLLLLPALANCYRPFMVPDCRLQAGYPRGMRVWIPDFSGIELFTFRGQLNSPIQGEETGGLVGNVRAPIGGYWVFKVDGLVLNPGDVVYFWTTVIKEKQTYSRPNQTWTVPSREKFVDLSSPIPSPDSMEPTSTTITTAAAVEERTPLLTTTPKSTPSTTPETTQSETTTGQTTTQSTTTQSTATTQSTTTVQTTTTAPLTTEDTTDSSTPAETVMATDVTEPTMKSTEETTKPTTDTTEPTTKLTEGTTTPPETTEEPTKSTDPSTKPTDPTTPPTTTVSKTPSLEKRSTTTEKTKLENRMPNSDLLPPKSEGDIETTTPSLDKPVSEFSEEPAFGPFPPFFPGPYRPMLPPTSPELEMCSNPFNFMEKINETKTDKLERQVAKLQCELAQFQRKFSQLNNVVENELMDIKKLNYNMVNRMARLENLILRATSAWS